MARHTASRVMARGAWLAGATLAALLALPSGAAAQDDPAAPAPTGGQSQTLVLQPIENGWAIAPDVRFGEVNDRSATFVGGYGGWMMDRTLLVGAGGYWLANNESDFEMAYGGAVVEYLARGTERIGFGARGLVGGGSATMSRTFDRWWPVDPVAMPHGRDLRGMRGWPAGWPNWPGDDLRPPNMRLVVDETFFIFEPQVNVLLSVTSWMRVNAGVGYRVIAGADLLGDQLRGVSGTVAVQFGGGGH